METDMQTVLFSCVLFEIDLHGRANLREPHLEKAR